MYPKFKIHDKSALPSYRNALVEIEKQDKFNTDTEDNLFDPSIESFPFPETLQQTILTKIGSRSGIILEKQLRDLIKTMQTEPGNLIKVETFFEALGISKLEDIDFMLKSFMPYLICEDCDPDSPTIRKIEKESSLLLDSSPSQSSSLCMVPLDDITPPTHLELSSIEEMVQANADDVDDEKNETNKSPEIYENFVGPTESQDQILSLIDITIKKQPSTQEKNAHIGHNLSLDAAFVHKALKQFVLR